MLNLLNIIGESYSLAMAVINFACFGSVCVCIGYLFVAAALGMFDKKYKGIAFSALLWVIIMFVLHFILLETFGIPVLLPPVDTLFFTEFMHVIQYIASFSLVIVTAFIFVMVALSRADKSYNHSVVSALIYLGLLIIIHFYVEDNFGIKIIFPPNLW